MTSSLLKMCFFFLLPHIVYICINITTIVILNDIITIHATTKPCHINILFIFCRANPHSFSKKSYYTRTRVIISFNCTQSNYYYSRYRSIVVFFSQFQRLPWVLDLCVKSSRYLKKRSTYIKATKYIIYRYITTTTYTIKLNNIRHGTPSSAITYLHYY